MRLERFLLACAALVCGVAWCAGPAAEEGFLTNGSMTQGGAVPDGWDPPKTEEGPGRVVAARDARVFKGAPASLRLAIEGGAAKGNIARAVPGVAGKEVAVTGWVRAEGKLDRATLAFVCPGAEPAWYPVKEFGPAGTWQRVCAKVKLPPSDQPAMLLLVVQGSGAGRAWLDELAVLPGERFRPEPLVTEFGAPPLYAYLAWKDKAHPVEGGVLLSAPTSQGGMGFGLTCDLSAFAERTPALTVTVGQANRAKAVRLVLSDADGTAHEYTFKLEGISPGATATVAANDGASLKEPGKVGDAGKKEGFDLAHVVHVGVVGDWSGVPIELTLRRLELVDPTAETLAAREKLRNRLAAEAERRRQAEAQQAARTAELLRGAPHPADGPDVRHVAPVAPDILALQIQEKEFTPVAQRPYVPAEGDQIVRTGTEKVLVVEGGEVRESLKDVVVQRKGAKLGDLAVNAGRIRPDDKVTGQDLTDETVDQPAAYRITGVDDPAWPRPAPPTHVWWKRKPNAYRSLASEIQVFLKLPMPLAEGKSYRIDFPGVNFRQASVVYRHEPAKVRSVAVHVSAIGFRPDDPFKRAYLSVWLGTGGAHHYSQPPRFDLLDDAGKSVFGGQAVLLKSAGDKETFKAGRNYSKTDVLGMDFGAFATPGRYRVRVEGIGCSWPFDIAPDVWTRAFRLSMKGLLHHRSGIALGPPFTDYVRPRNMHPADGFKVFASPAAEIEGGGQDGIFQMLMKSRTDRLLPEAWGGHMDAGDWDRNSAHPAAMWLLVDLYELFPKQIGPVKLALPPAEAANAVPDILDEVLWNLDLYRRLQTPEGGVGGGIESTSHPRPGEASWQESLLLSAFAPDPKASFIYAAAAAKLARALTPIDKALSDKYAASAAKAWDWARAHGEEFLGRISEKDRARMAEEFRHRRNLAALELWLLTGQKSFHDEFRATTLLGDPQAEMVKQLKAVVSYARLADGRGDAALRDAARKWIVQAADTALAFADGNAFGTTTCIPQLPPMGFVGYLSTPEMIGAVLPHAWLLTREPKYLAGAVRACQFAAGANPDNRSLTTGLGPDPVRFPLHVDSYITARCAPAGITVYGISDPAENYAFDGWAHTWFLQKMVPPSRTWPANESYWDIHVVPSTNEYTIHQTIIPTAFYWGFLAARAALE